MSLNEEILKELRDLKKLLKQSFINQYWGYVIRKSEGYITIPAGTSKTILHEKGTAMVLYILAILNNPEAIVEFKHNGESVKSSINELYSCGLTSYNPSMFWLAKYDTTNSIYIALFTPSPPRYIHGDVRFIINAPESSDVRLKYVVHYYKYRG